MSRTNDKHSGEFKQKVVEYILENRVSAKTAAKHFGIKSDTQPKQWLKLYQTKGSPALYEDNRGKAPRKGNGAGGRPPSFKPKPNETLEQEVERLRAENAYLKKLKALIHL